MKRYPLEVMEGQEWAVFTCFDKQVFCHPDLAPIVERALLREVLQQISDREAVQASKDEWAKAVRG